jgi:hypothetical protein
MQHYIQNINYDSLFSKHLQDRDYVLSFLEHIKGKPVKNKIFLLADWKRVLTDYTIKLELEVDMTKSLDENIIEYLYQLKISYNRLKRLSPEYFYSDVLESIKELERDIEKREELNLYNNASGYKNIVKKGDWWRVSIRIGGKLKSFGDFETVDEALVRRNGVYKDLKLI